VTQQVIDLNLVSLVEISSLNDTVLETIDLQGGMPCVWPRVCVCVCVAWP
jgi:hypothetical protein